MAQPFVEFSKQRLALSQGELSHSDRMKRLRVAIRRCIEIPRCALRAVGLFDGLLAAPIPPALLRWVDPGPQALLDERGETLHTPLPRLLALDAHVIGVADEVVPVLTSEALRPRSSS